MDGAFLRMNAILLMLAFLPVSVWASLVADGPSEPQLSLVKRENNVSTLNFTPLKVCRGSLALPVSLLCESQLKGVGDADLQFHQDRHLEKEGDHRRLVKFELGYYLPQVVATHVTSSGCRVVNISEHHIEMHTELSGCGCE
jgi:hypothetical protein